MNRFFLYEGMILRAANHSLQQVLLYMEPDRKVFWGTPQQHTRDITTICKRLCWLEYREQCEDVENVCATDTKTNVIYE
jgi:hypothetical protein